LDGSVLVVTQRAISLPFSISESYGISFTTNENKIYKDRVFLAVMTGLNERVMRPNYGTQIKTAIFENEAVAIPLVDATVRESFSQWLPTLVLQDLYIELDLNTMHLDITISYKLPNETTDEVKISTGTFTRSGDLLEGNN
jgi:phage baseplate assembly protein W